MKRPVLSHALAVTHATEFLALDPRAFGRAVAFPEEAPKAEVRPGPKGAGAVAVLRIDGLLAQRSVELPELGCVIDGYDAIAARFADALSDPEVGAVVLVIDSPGGSVPGCFEAVRRMRAARDAAAKPVFAFADELIASAAYALATVADAGIFAPRSALVGSVGVFGMHCDESLANEAAGLRFTILRSGALKNELCELEPLEGERRASAQRMIDDWATEFFELVAEARGLDASAVAALEGAVFSAPRAVELGLATAVASFEEVLAMAAGEFGDEEDIDDGDDQVDDEEAPAEPSPAAARAVARLQANRAEASTLRAELDRRDAARLVRDAIVARKVAPSRREEMVALMTTLGLEGLRATLAAMPAQPRPPLPKVRPRSRVDAEAIEGVIAASLDMTPAQFADAKHAATGEGASS